MNLFISVAGLFLYLMSPSAVAGALTQLNDDQRMKSVQMLEALREKHSDILQEAQGILVAGVASGSQADLAGIQAGDIIASYAGTPVNNIASFVATVSQLSSKSKGIDMVVIRNYTKKVVKLVSGKVGVEVMNIASLVGRVTVDNKPQIFVQLGLPTHAVAISPDGRMALSGAGNSMKLWDIASGREIRTFAGHTDAVTTVTFSPNGRNVLSGSQDGSWTLWEIATGNTIQSVVGHGKPLGVSSMVFSPDGRQALSGGGDQQVKLWDLATGINIRSMIDLQKQSSGVDSVAYSPDGQRALSTGYYASKGTFGNTMHYVLKLWDVATGQHLRTMDGHSGFVKSVAFSPDGWQALSGGTDNTVKLWDLATGKVIRTMNGHSSGINSVAFSPDGKQALSTGIDGVKLWDLVSGKVIRTFTSIAPQEAVFSPDGRQALSVHINEMLLWDTATGALIRRLHGNSFGLNSVAVSPDGRRILSGGLAATSIWDVTTGRKMARVLDRSADLAFSSAISPDGRQILSGNADKTLKLRDASTGQLIRTFTGHSGVVMSVAFSHDGRQAISSGGYTNSMWKGVQSTQSDRTIRLWDVATGENIRTLTGHDQPVASVSLSPDGKQALSAASLGEGVKLWDLASGTVIRTFPGFTHKVVFSPDGRYALFTGIEGTTNSIIKLVDLGTGQEVRSFKGHSNFVGSVAFSPDGKLALSGSRDNTIKLWDVATGKEIRIMKGHSGEVSTVAFSPDGRFALSGSSDSTARIWEVATGKEIIQMIAFDDGEWLSITPEGYFAASSLKAAENLNIRKGMKVYGIDQFYDVFYRPDIVEATLTGKDITKLTALTIDNAIKNPPPIIEKVEVAGSSDAEAVKVAYRIKSDGGGIGEVRVFHNGKLVESDGVARNIPDTLLGKSTNQVTSEVLVSEMRNLSISAAKDPSLIGAVISPTKSDLYESFVEIEPIPGENDISVTAFNAQNSVQSVARTASFTSSKAPLVPQLYILAVGIDEYKDKSASLAFAVKDSRDIALRWKAQAANIFDEKNIFVETLSNVQASREGILAKINQIATHIKPTDHFVLFVASHGVLLGDQYYMVTSDYDGAIQPSKLISANEIVSFSKRIKSLSQLYILDTCHAGGMSGVVSGLYDARVSVLAKKMGLHMFAAASSAEEALDGFEGNGLFTHTLLAGLNNNKHADSNDNKQVSLMELGAYSKGQTAEIAKRVNHKQDPLIINFGQDNPVYKLQ